MIAMLRRGRSQRAVARELRVSLHTAQRWWERAKGLELGAVDWQQRPNALLIYSRRTTEKDVINLLGHGWEIDPLRQHRLVRSEIDLQSGQINFYRLRRREPSDQPLIKTVSYRLPERRFDTRPRHRHPVTPIP